MARGHRIGGAGSEGLPGLGRERRRQARAYLRWCALREPGGLPSADIFLAEADDAGKACAFFPLAADMAGRPCAPSLAERLGIERVRLTSEAAPLTFRLTAPLEDRQGLLLPLADWRGRLAGYAVIDHGFTVAGTTALPVPPAADARPATDPWARPGSGATALLGRRREEALPFATRLAAARTWVALALYGPMPARASGMHAALCAAFDLLIHVERDRFAWQALGHAPETDDASIVADALFPEPGTIGLALAQARRLGLDAATFGAYLADAGGHEALAAAERRLLAGEPPIAVAAPEPTLALAPVDHGFLVRLAGRASQCPDLMIPTRVAA